MRHRQAKKFGSARRSLTSGIAAVCLAVGIGTVGVGLQSHASPEATAFQTPVTPSSPPALISTPPTPAPAAAPASPATPAVPAPPPGPVPATAPAPPPAASGVSSALVGPVLPASKPATVAIDTIGVSSGLMKLGLEADGTVAVPPGDADAPAGWYENAPTPGELGSSIILGHVNSIQTGVGVFYRLHELQDADQVSVTREDGTVAVFQVYRVDTYDKASFPAAQVYGNAGRAELRLITCGGYDPSTGEFNQNTVAYAYLISSHPA
ncbi:class F sortase [Arthrobacter sp. A5]|uniref:class F sortase n=1 Tax=Arthrobacter sp. A5 TaxID=576926 RepID=UPI003DA99D8E